MGRRYEEAASDRQRSNMGLRCNRQLDEQDNERLAKGEDYGLVSPHSVRWRRNVPSEGTE